MLGIDVILLLGIKLRIHFFRVSGLEGPRVEAFEEPVRMPEILKLRLRSFLLEHATQLPPPRPLGNPKWCPFAGSTFVLLVPLSNEPERGVTFFQPAT